ncbi:hypothetical protein [Parapedobacter koreensis]|uniref:Uncharacterized protein n=1 Tax=Parapedobacter koreensis TaxID=332977 RepID=A0A1H7QBU1_9SPHI|nr:hypothetical protein [Parapedobacter koreensis]SEL44737.1 hypothetical protein SAMN05421740_105255 [Parapedobacter koreensis]
MTKFFGLYDSNCFLMGLTKSLICLSFIVCLSADTFGQDVKEVLVSRAHRKVPNGKVWSISNQETHKVLFSEGALQSGTFCYAFLYSNPGHVFGIAYQDGLEPKNRRPKNIGFTFQNMEETIGSDVYLIKPHFILRNGIGMDAVKNSLSWEYEPTEAVFYPETVVFTNGCISEMVLFEREMTETDKAKHQERIAKTEQGQTSGSME